VSATVANASQLVSGGNYLSYTGAGSTSHSIYRTMGNSVDRSASHQISFNFRVDDFATGTGNAAWSNAYDRFEFYSANATAPTGYIDDITTSDLWTSYTFAFWGAARGNASASTFAVYNPTNPGELFDENAYSDLGATGVGTTSSGTTLAVTEGTTYQIVLDIHPTTLTWDLSISDGVNTAWSNGLNFWGTDTTQERLMFQTRGNNSGDTRIASIDSISIIPEPGTLALVGMALSALCLLRRRAH
jgi:hypothetical protein